MTEPELSLLGALEPFIDTPRQAKRMFNLYRMLRSTRDLSDASAFLGDGDKPGDSKLGGTATGHDDRGPARYCAMCSTLSRNEILG